MRIQAPATPARGTPHLRNRSGSRPRSPSGVLNRWKLYKRVATLVLDLSSVRSQADSRRFRASLRRPSGAPLGHDAALEEPPQINPQPPRQGHDADAPLAFAPATEALLKPAAVFAVRLTTQPRPDELDHQRPHSAIAGLADPLIARHRSAVVRRGRQTAQPSQLAWVGWPAEQCATRVHPALRGDMVPKVAHSAKCIPAVLPKRVSSLASELPEPRLGRYLSRTTERAFGSSQ